MKTNWQLHNSLNIKTSTNLTRWLTGVSFVSHIYVTCDVVWQHAAKYKHHSIFSAWQIHSHRHQTLNAPVSIKTMVFYQPLCISIHPLPRWKHLETYSVCCWLVLLQVSPQPKPQAHPVFVSSAFDNPKCLWQTVNKLPHRKLPHQYPPLLLAHHLQTALLLFSPAKYPNSFSLTSNPATLLRTHPLLLPLPLTSQFSVLPQNPKSTRSCPTVQTSNLIQIPSPSGFSKNVYPYLFLQSPILSTSPSLPALKESIISPLLKKPTQDKEVQLSANLESVSHFQNNRTCHQIPCHVSPHF